MKVTLNRERGMQLLRTIYDAWMNKKGLLWNASRQDAPQNRFVPPTIVHGSFPWQWFILVATVSDRRIVSERNYAAHILLHQSYPRIYSERVADMSEMQLKDVLYSSGVGVPAQTARSLPVIARTLRHSFDSEPALLYKHKSIDWLMAFRKKGKREAGENPLPGLGAKVASLLAIYYEEVGLVQVPDAVPVDMHIQRLFLSTGVVMLDGTVTNDHLEPPIRHFVSDVCAQKGLDRIEMVHALWFLGRRGCSSCYRHHDRAYTCPVYAECGGRTSARSYFKRGVWDPKSERYRKGGERTFRLAPISQDSRQMGLFQKK